MRNFILGAALFLGMAGAALAQSAPPPVQQTAQRLDSATFVVVSTNYNTVNTQGVATVNPPAGQFAYITRIELEAIQDATSSANVNLAFTSTGLGVGATASPQWGLSLAATADATLYRDVNFGLPLKSFSPGAAVTVTSPAALAHTAYGIKVYGYFSP